MKRRSKLPDLHLRGPRLAVLLFYGIAAAQDQSPKSLLSDTALQRAQADVDRIRTLVNEGTLPQTRLRDAEDHLTDVQDDQVLAHTLYSSTRIEDITDAQSVAMEEAAERRVQRQQTILEHKRELLNAGILARAELTADEDELHSRERVLQLADNRRHLIAELHAMALTEERLQQSIRRGEAGSAMIRFTGSGTFQEEKLGSIARLFTQQFGANLPVSAIGQTAVHNSLGLDHRHRVDVALSPDSAQGKWLRHLLEQEKIPYLAFRSAMAGAATGPHIHIGPESTRLHLLVAPSPHS